MISKQVHSIPSIIQDTQQGRDAFASYYNINASENEDFEENMNDIQRKLGNLDLRMGPVKKEQDAFIKLINKKEGKTSKINDIVRCSFFSSSLIHEYKVINYLNSKQNQTGWDIYEIRDSHFPVYTNGFSVKFKHEEKLFPRLHRDLRVILIKYVQGVAVFSELQMHLDGYEKINKKTHDLYDVEREILAKQKDLTGYFSEENVYQFFNTRLDIIKLNEEAVEIYNKNALQNGESIYLLPGRQIIQKIAKKEGMSYQEKIFKMMTKGLKIGKGNNLSEMKLRKDYEDWLISEMEKVVTNDIKIQFMQDQLTKVA